VMLSLGRGVDFQRAFGREASTPLWRTSARKSHHERWGMT